MRIPAAAAFPVPEGCDILPGVATLLSVEEARELLSNIA